MKDSSNDLSHLDQQIRSEVLKRGVDKVGVADLTPAKKFIAWQGGPLLDPYHRAISIGTRLSDAVVDSLFYRDTVVALMTYERHIYGVVNRQLDQIALRVVHMLQQAGWHAFPIHASQVIQIAPHHLGAFSHKLAANLAGLGWIGRSCLLVTPEFGPRIRWATVLTDAPLTPGKPIKNGCDDDCNYCVTICPAQAFTGREFDPSEPRETRMDANACDIYLEKRKEQTGAHICGLCVAVCPHGTNKP
ncbi:MAG: 4Fe-4S double cluster binding domain-containing protein [Candidatus Heimdallarchaeota archaeon]